MKVVAFSYEIGSFGKSVAMDLAQNTKLTFVPFSQVYQLALSRNARFRHRKEEVKEGRENINTWEGHFFSDPSFTSLFESIALEIAARGDVILIGAGIQAVLSAFDGILRVHVRASLPVRVRRFMELNGITVSEANQTIKWWDQRRRALSEFNSYLEHTGCIEACDLVINTDHVTIPAASRLLQTMIQELPGPADPPVWQANLARLARAKRIECAVREGVSALGLAPLEVHPVEDSPEAFCLSGFVHTEEDAAKALGLAKANSEGSEVRTQLKLLQLHGDLVPPTYWKADD